SCLGDGVWNGWTRRCCYGAGRRLPAPCGGVQVRAISPSVVSLVLAALTLAGCAATPGIVGSGKAPAASASAVTLAAPVSAGSAKGPLTIESAAQRAVAWHPSVREAAAKVNQQKAGIDEARAGYGPTLGWDVGTSYANGG